MDWLPVSAALLLTGALALCLGSFLLPASDSTSGPSSVASRTACHRSSQHHTRGGRLDDPQHPPTPALSWPRASREPTSQSPSGRRVNQSRSAPPHGPVTSLFTAAIGRTSGPRRRGEHRQTQHGNQNAAQDSLHGHTPNLLTSKLIEHPICRRYNWVRQLPLAPLFGNVVHIGNQTRAPRGCDD